MRLAVNNRANNERCSVMGTYLEALHACDRVNPQRALRKFLGVTPAMRRNTCAK